MSGAGWAVLPVNFFVAVYGGAWLAKLLVGQPYIGALLGLGNLLIAILTQAKERPTVAQRVRAAARAKSPYSSIMALLVLLSLAECVVFLAIAGALRWLKGGL